jgi:hypothetical protein
VRSRTFPVRNALSPIQLSQAATSLRKPDHAAPNDVALCQTRVEKVQLSFFCFMPLRCGYGRQLNSRCSKSSVLMYPRGKAIHVSLAVRGRLSNKVWARHLLGTAANVVQGATVHHPGLCRRSRSGDFVDGTTDEVEADSRRNACLVLRSSERSSYQNTTDQQVERSCKRLASPILRYPHFAHSKRVGRSP